MCVCVRFYHVLWLRVYSFSLCRCNAKKKKKKKNVKETNARSSQFDLTWPFSDFLSRGWPLTEWARERDSRIVCFLYCQEDQYFFPPPSSLQKCRCCNETSLYQKKKKNLTLVCGKIYIYIYISRWFYYVLCNALPPPNPTSHPHSSPINPSLTPPPFLNHISIFNCVLLVLS